MVPEGAVDPAWTNASTVTVLVDERPSGPILVGPPPDEERETDGAVLVNGRPLEVHGDPDLEPGVVVTARIPFSGRPGRADEGLEAKVRPAVVTRVEEDFLVLRAVYTTNREGRGRRVEDWEAAGLDHGSVVADEETLVARTDAFDQVGALTDGDRRRLGI